MHICSNFVHRAGRSRPIALHDRWHACTLCSVYVVTYREGDSSHTTPDPIPPHVREGLPSSYTYQEATNRVGLAGAVRAHPMGRRVMGW